MDNSGLFSNSIQQTEISDAYNYHTYSTYIKSDRFAQSKFSSNCIFCNSSETVSLMRDGSFRSCKICKKNFKAKYI